MNLGFGDVVALLKTVQERQNWQGLGDLRLLQRYARARKEEEEEEGRDGGREEDGQRLGEKDR